MKKLFSSRLTIVAFLLAFVLVTGALAQQASVRARIFKIVGYSSTSAIPTATSGELNVGEVSNVLYTKDSSGNVKALATSAAATQTANYVYAGPTTGAAAAASFRALVLADIPATVFSTPSAIGSTTPAAGIFTTLTGTAVTASTSLTINGGTAVTKILSAAGTLDFADTATLTSTDLTITVTGAAVGDPVFLATPAAPDANGAFTAFVSAADTVTVRFNNYSGGSINPASASYRVAVMKF